MNTSYNEAARYTAKQIAPEAFLRFLLPSVFLHWRWLGWDDSQTVSFPGDPERRCDTVARFERIDGSRPPVLLIVEFESEPASDMAPREGEYRLRLRRESPFQTEPRVPYDVVGAIIYLTGPPQPATWTMSPDDFAGLGMTITARVPCFCEESAKALFDAMVAGTTSRGLLAWVPLMAGSDTPEAVARWVELALAEPNDRIRRDVGVFANVFANLNPRSDLWRTALEGWQMKTSPFLDEIVRETTQEVEGRSGRQMLFAVIGSRLGKSIPDEIRRRISAEKDFARMIRWTESMGNISSFQKLRDLLDT